MKTILRSDDVTCPSCIGRIEQLLAKVEGVRDATVHFHSRKIEVEHDSVRAPVKALRQTLREAGYESRIQHF